MVKKLLPLILLFVFVYQANAQRLLPDSLKSKYHMLTWDELENSKNPTSFLRTITPTDAPDGFVRNIAEWERNQGVIIAYPSGGFGIPVDLIRQLADITHVYLVYSSSSYLSQVQSALSNGDVNTDNVSYHEIAINTYWTRDFSPWFIQYGDVPEVGIVNFDYNRNRPDDNNMPVDFGGILDVDVFGMDVVHTGGNYMCDGMGKAVSTDLVYDENSISNSVVDQRMEDYLGITDNIVVDDPLGDYIKHVDCWGKYLDVDKIIITEVPATADNYADYEATADYFSTITSSYGNNYEVYRVYAPNGQPYTNSLIMNGKVYVPVPDSGSASDWNDDAIASYQEAMPGYEIIAVPNTTAPEWMSTDALHCRTHEVPDLGMLHIYHSALYGQQDSEDGYEISADFVSYGGNDLIADSLRVYYEVNDGDWMYSLMSQQSGNTYTASIPSQNNGDTIRYIIKASDVSGRSESNPFIGFPDPHMFTVGDLTESNFAENIVNISTFPNPASDQLNIVLHNFNENNAQLVILDINGREYKRVDLSDIDDWKMLRLNISDLFSGTYIIRIIGDSKVITEKFICR